MNLTPNTSVSLNPKATTTANVLNSGNSSNKQSTRHQPLSLVHMFSANGVYPASLLPFPLESDLNWLEGMASLLNTYAALLGKCPPH